MNISGETLILIAIGILLIPVIIVGVIIAGGIILYLLGKLFIIASVTVGVLFVGLLMFVVIGYGGELIGAYPPGTTNQMFAELWNNIQTGNF